MLIWTEILMRLSLAAMFGAAIGLERERKNWTAGMRTHMMVCLGAALIMIVSAFGFSDVLGTAHVVLDPARIAAQVISGIGFIGAGTILLSKQGIVRGLTTASGLWTVAAIGLATGAGMYFAAVLTTFLAIIILWVLQPLEKRMFKQFRLDTIRIVINNDVNPLDILKELLENELFDFTNLSRDNSNDECIIHLKFKAIDKKKLLEIVNVLYEKRYIKEISWDT